MLDIRRGDVWMVEFPFGEGIGSKPRPAVVVQCDEDNRRLGTVLAAMVTSKTDRVGRERRHVVIEFDTEVGKSAGLWRDSVINCTQLGAIKKELFFRRLGELSDPLMDEVSNVLRSVLTL